MFCRWCTTFTWGLDISTPDNSTHDISTPDTLTPEISLSPHSCLCFYLSLSPTMSLSPILSVLLSFSLSLSLLLSVFCPFSLSHPVSLSLSTTHVCASIFLSIPPCLSLSPPPLLSVILSFSLYPTILYLFLSFPLSHSCLCFYLSLSHSCLCLYFSLSHHFLLSLSLPYSCLCYYLSLSLSLSLPIMWTVVHTKCLLTQQFQSEAWGLICVYIIVHTLYIF